tara:strand:- start:2185 stop:3297 length:1113 start_codon:yes stop_codon:yes gene_type:complete
MDNQVKHDYFKGRQGMAKTKDYGLGPSTFPRGWFVIAESSELTDTPVPLTFFDLDLALYRGKSGKPILIDAYCPHMGTHLAASDTTVLAQKKLQIEGDSIRCPYHGWRFNSDGLCDHIPYYDGPMPRSAILTSYEVREVMGCIMIWFDEEGGEPDYEPPFIDEWSNPQWVKWQLDHCGEIDVHPQEVMDNIADIRHLEPTHGATCVYYENEIDGYLCIQRQGGFHEDYGTLLETETWYTGPGILISRQIMNGITSYEFIAHTPVHDGCLKVWHGVLSKGNNTPPNQEDRKNAAISQQMAMDSLAADFSVWTNKRAATRIIQLNNDGPFGSCRKWYSQFYISRTEAKNILDKINGVHTVSNFPTPFEYKHS